MQQAPTFGGNTNTRIAHTVQAVFGLPGVALADWTVRATKALTSTLELTVCSAEIGNTGQEFEPHHLSVSASPDWLDGEALSQRAAAAIGRRAAVPCGLEPTAWEASPLAKFGVLDSAVRLAMPIERQLQLIVHLGARGSGERLSIALSILLECLRSRAVLLAPQHDKPIDWLSVRESEVFDYLASGMTLPEIARQLHRSQHTIHDHVKAIYRKSGSGSRAELMAKAFGVLGAVALPEVLAEVPERDAVARA